MARRVLESFVVKRTLRFSTIRFCPSAAVSESAFGDSRPAAEPSAGIAESGANGVEGPKEHRETRDRIVNALEQRRTWFETVLHPPVRTSQEAAKARNAPLHAGAKCMLLKQKKTENFVVVVISAAERIDNKRLRKQVGKNLRAATEEEVFEVTGARPGAVPPFGSLYRQPVPTFMDESLRTQGETISFNVALRTESLTMRQQDYEAIEQPTLVNVVVAEQTEAP
eukprot:scaffold3307_cov265-Pinguiococcus_pyrenoidosus.AAC.19